MSRLINRSVLLAATMILSLAAGGAKAEDAVLLASTVPGYVPGMVVSSADRLSVPEGAIATLLFQSGGMLRLRGPFEGTLGDPQAKDGDSSVAKLADLFRLRGVDATVIGGTRSTGGRAQISSLEDVLVDPQRSGTYCFDPSASIWITRPGNEKVGYVVRRKGSSRTLGWPSGSERVEWPADVPIDDGSQFEFTAGGAARATVTFRALPAAAPSGPARMAKAIVLGCHDQFDAELHKVSRSIAEPELWMTTDRGRQPTYKAGEPIALTVVSDADGYLYCIAASGAGAMPIFPGTAIDGAQLRGSMPLLIPGRRQPVGLKSVAGVQHIRCWLADRDITPELPHALLGSPAGRLPDQLASDLPGLFSHIGGTRIATDGIEVKVD